MFIAALSAISKTWKQHRAHQQMNGLRTCSMYVHTHTHNGMSLSHKKKDEVMPLQQCGWT